MVVFHGDESHGIESVKQSPPSKIQDKHGNSIKFQDQSSDHARSSKKHTPKKMIMKDIFTFSYDFSGAARGLQKSGEKNIYDKVVSCCVNIDFIFPSIACLAAPSKRCQLNPKGWLIDTL